METAGKKKVDDSRQQDAMGQHEPALVFEMRIADFGMKLMQKFNLPEQPLFSGRKERIGHFCLPSIDTHFRGVVIHCYRRDQAVDL